MGSGGLSRVGSRGGLGGLGANAAASLATLAALDAQLPQRLWGWGLIEEFSAAAAAGDDMPAPVRVVSEEAPAAAGGGDSSEKAMGGVKALGFGSPVVDRGGSPGMGAETVSTAAATAAAAAAAAGYAASDLQLVRLYYGSWQVRSGLLLLLPCSFGALLRPLFPFDRCCWHSLRSRRAPRMRGSARSSLLGLTPSTSACTGPR